MNTTSLAYMIASIELGEWGDIRSILDELYLEPTANQLKILHALLSSVNKRVVFFNALDGSGWEYTELRD